MHYVWKTQKNNIRNINSENFKSQQLILFKREHNNQSHLRKTIIQLLPTNILNLFFIY